MRTPKAEGNMPCEQACASHDIYEKKGVSEFKGEISRTSRRNHLIEMQGVDGFYEEWTNQGENGKKDVKNAGSSHDMYENKG
jgi:hypothetical protein